MESGTEQVGAEQVLDPERTRAARAMVGMARSLDELLAILNGPAVAALPASDFASLPTFGSDRPRFIGCVSCDRDRLLLIHTTEGEEADPFVIRLRSEVALPPRRR